MSGRARIQAQKSGIGQCYEQPTEIIGSGITAFNHSMALQMNGSTIASYETNRVIEIQDIFATQRSLPPRYSRTEL